MKIIRNIDDKISFVLFVIMLAIAFVNVIARYVFHASLSFTEEFSTNAFVLLSCLGAAGAAKDDSHFNMSFISDRVPGRGHDILLGINNVLAGITCLFLTVTGVIMTISQYQMHTLSVAMMIPTWIYGSFVPIGAAFMTYRFFERAITYFMGKGTKEK